MTYQHLWQRLTPLYDINEAQAIIRMVLEEEFHLSFADILIGKVNELSQDETTKLAEIVCRLAASEPVQYVLGRENFAGRTFYVESGVLIPRPETEMLVQWIEEDYNTPVCGLLPPAPLQILDIGTGSGCIAITLALDILNSSVAAWDISGDALLIARDNALRLGAKVNFQLQDALSIEATDRCWDIIVSNPPYICEKECEAMAENVLQHEPHTALFVPNDDPLRFYTAIAKLGKKTLTKGGTLYFETNPLYIKEVKTMLKDLGYTMIQLRKDQYDKQRFVKATLL